MWPEPGSGFEADPFSPAGISNRYGTPRREGHGVAPGCGSCELSAYSSRWRLSPLKSPTDAVHISLVPASPSLGVRILARKEVRPRSLISWSVGVVVVTLLVLSSLGVFSSTKAPKETVVSSITSSRYGSVLVVGGNASSGLHNFPLYEFSGDVGHHFGCATTRSWLTTSAQRERAPHLYWTGGRSARGRQFDDWPAFTTRVRRLPVTESTRSCWERFFARHRQADHLRRSSAVPV